MFNSCCRAFCSLDDVACSDGANDGMVEGTVTVVVGSLGTVTVVTVRCSSACNWYNACNSSNLVSSSCWTVAALTCDDFPRSRHTDVSSFGADLLSPRVVMSLAAD